MRLFKRLTATMLAFMLMFDFVPTVRANEMSLTGEFVINNLSESNKLEDLEISFNLSEGDTIYTLSVYDFDSDDELYCNLGDDYSGTDSVSFDNDYFFSSRSRDFDLKYGDQDYFDETNVSETNEKFEKILEDCFDDELTGIVELNGEGIDEYAHALVWYSFFYEPGTLNKSININAYLFNDYSYLIEGSENKGTFNDTSLSNVKDLKIPYDYDDDDAEVYLAYNCVITKIGVSDAAKYDLGYINNDGWFDGSGKKKTGELYSPIYLEPYFDTFEAFYDSSKTKVLTNIYDKAYNGVLGEYYKDLLNYYWYLFNPISQIAEEIDLTNTETRTVNLEGPIEFSYLSEDDCFGLYCADGDVEDNKIKSNPSDEWYRATLVLNYDDDEHPFNSRDRIVIELDEADEDIRIDSLFSGDFDISTDDHKVYTLTLDTATVMGDCIGVTLKKEKDNGPFNINSVKLYKDYDLVLSDEYRDDNVPSNVECYCEINLGIGAANAFIAKTPVIKKSNTPTSSGSKRYKTEDNDTTKDVTGIAKKGSKRIIKPIEGRKIKEVIVKDEKGNPIDVIMNEDGTYTFIQPASNVSIKITYEPREMTLEEGTTKVTLDGEAINSDASVISSGDKKLVPIRVVTESLGGTVAWKEEEPDLIQIDKGGKAIDILLSSNVIKVDGVDVSMSTKPVVVSNRTYLPVDFYEDIFNLVVQEYEDQLNSYMKIYENY